jgi:hypothetical protein
MKSLSLPATKEVKMETPHCHLHTKAMRRKTGVQYKTNPQLLARKGYSQMPRTAQKKAN